MVIRQSRLCDTDLVVLAPGILHRCRVLFYVKLLLGSWLFPYGAGFLLRMGRRSQSSSRPAFATVVVVVGDGGALAVQLRCSSGNLFLRHRSRGLL